MMREKDYYEYRVNKDKESLDRELERFKEYVNDIKCVDADTVFNILNFARSMDMEYRNLVKSEAILSVLSE